MASTTTPSTMIAAAIRKGLPAGVEFSEGANAFFKGADYMLTADATRRGFRWCLSDICEGDDTYFPSSALTTALAALAAA
jgi:hypothetical protein